MHPVNEYKFYYIYKITNTINGKIYVGVHASNNLEDRYLGSGTKLKKAIKKYGRDNFTKEILQVFETYDEALNEERRIVTLEFVKDPKTYNLEIGGLGGKVWTKELREKMSITKKGSIPWNKGKQVGGFMSDSAKIELRQRMTGENNHMFGVNVNSILSPERNAERLKKISENNRKPKSTTKELEKYAKQRFWIVNKENKLFHCVDKSDERLLNGQYQLGRKWKDV